MTDDIDVLGSINAKCDRLTEILQKLQVEGGPRFEESELVIDWLAFFRLGLNTKGEIGNQITDLEQCKAQAKKLASNLKSISPDVLEEIEERSSLITREPTNDNNFTGSIVPRPEHESYEVIMNELVDDITNGIKMLKDIRAKYWGDDSTKGKQVLAYKIAYDVARVYEELQNKIPGYGPGNEHKRPTLYIKVVSEVYVLMGIKAEPRDPCKAAIEKLKAVGDV